MPINWEDLQKTIFPIKDFETLSQRFQVAFSYPLIRAVFNFTLPNLIDYSEKLLGGDARGRYADYLAKLREIFSRLHALGVKDVLELHTRTSTRAKLEDFVTQTGAAPLDIGEALKYLAYWFIPSEKYLSGLVRDNAQISEAIKILSGLGVKTNLEILQQGNNASGRQSLAKASGLSMAVISELVNRADFSRMPWASKATISNIIGAGYGSVAQLANAVPEQLYADFFSYGNSIGKNLKLGNEIENSYRIARIIPSLLQAD